MSSLNKVSFQKVFISYLPLIFLLVSVLNDLDFNYLKIENFSFNFLLDFKKSRPLRILINLFCRNNQ